MKFSPRGLFRLNLHNADVVAPPRLGSEGGEIEELKGGCPPTSCSMSSFAVPVMEDGDGQYTIHPVTGKRIDRPNEWKPPNPDLSWRVLSDPYIATGIYHADGSMMTHIEVGSESELCASRCLATGVRNKSGKHKGITPQCGVGVLSYSLQIRLKGVYAIKRLGKLILQCFKGRCAHGGIDSHSSNVPMHAPAPRTEVDEQQRSGCGLRDMTCWTLVNSRLIVYQCCQGFACESLLFSLETSRINHFRTTATRFDVLSSSITTMSLLSLSRQTYVVSVDSTNFPLTSRE